MKRREFIVALSALLATAVPGRGFAESLSWTSAQLGNFRYIYSNPRLRQEFLAFLTNVFHLYPEEEFHQALVRAVRAGCIGQADLFGLAGGT